MPTPPPRNRPGARDYEVTPEDIHNVLGGLFAAPGYLVDAVNAPLQYFGVGSDRPVLGRQWIADAVGADASSGPFQAAEFAGPDPFSKAKILMGLGTGAAYASSRLAQDAIAHPVASAAARQRAHDARALEKWGALERQTGKVEEGVKIKTTGNYVGAPEGVRSPQKKSAMVGKYADRIEAGLEAGVPPGYFYDEGRRTVAEISDPGQARRNALLIGSTSSQVGPRQNMDYTIRAVDQASMGGPEALNAGMYPNAMRQEQTDIMEGLEPFLGYKRTRYGNLLTPTDALPERGISRLEMGPPADRWEGRGTGFTGVPDAAGSIAWTDEIRNRALGRVNRKRAQRGERPLSLEEAQEIHWAEIRAELEGMGAPRIGPDDTIQGAVDRFTYQHSWEAAPGYKSGHLPQVGTTYMSPREYQNRIENIVLDEQGKDRIIRGMGGELQRPSLVTPGYYKGEYSPGRQSRSLVSFTETGGLDPASAARVQATEATRALMTGQDAYAGSARFPTTKNPDVLDIDLGGQISGLEYQRLMDEMDQRMHHGFALPTDRGVRIQTGDPDLNKGWIVELKGRDFGWRNSGEGPFYTQKDAQDFVKYEVGAPSGARVRKLDSPVTEASWIAKDAGLNPREQTPSRLVGGMYETLPWRERKATQSVLETIDNPAAPRLAEHADSPAMRELAGEFAGEYRALQEEAGMTVNEDLVRVLEAWRDDGLAGVRELVKKGWAPAVALGVLAGFEQSGAPDGSPQA